MANKDLSFSSDAGDFRLRVAALIIDQGRLLAVKPAHHDCYYTVGGRVQHGESSAEAVIRESFEETGRHFEIERLLFVYESFFSADGRSMHEVSFVYLMKGDASGILSGSSTDQRIETLQWLPIDELPRRNLVPKFLKRALVTLPDEVVHIIARE